MSRTNEKNDSSGEAPNGKVQSDHYKRYAYRGLGNRWFSWVKDIEIICGDIRLPNPIREYFGFGSDIFEQPPSYSYESTVKAARLQLCGLFPLSPAEPCPCEGPGRCSWPLLLGPPLLLPLLQFLRGQDFEQVMTR